MIRASSALESRLEEVVKRKTETQNMRTVLKRTWNMKNTVDLMGVS